MIVEKIENPHPAQLLDDYLTIYSQRDPASLGNTLVRQLTIDGRHLAARYALGNKGRLHDIIKLARTGSFAEVGLTPQEFEPARLALVARVLVLQNTLPNDMLDGLGLYDLILEVYGPDKVPVAHQNLHAQLAYNQGQIEKTRRLLDIYRRLHSSIRNTLRLNLVNPAHTRSAKWDEWLRALHDLMPAAHFTISDNNKYLAPLDRLSARPLAYHQDARKVSVAITCFKPTIQLITAVKSIVAQSWRHLEILLIDDGSPSEYRRLIDQCGAIDNRVKLVLLPENSGTYTARNVALDIAQGEFITFQDSDDWCHPSRIEHQLSLMLANPGLMATTSDGIKVDGDLTINRVGRPVVDISMPTTMLRFDEVKRRIGYFHGIRKSADGEYLERLRAAFGEGSYYHEKDTAYKLIRQGRDSLSRTDFGAGGWMHPAREAYKSAQASWHRQIKAGTTDPYMPRESNIKKLPASPHLLVNGQARPNPVRYDYILATDWRPYGAPAKAMIEEIMAIKSAGRSVGILQLETLRYMSTSVRPLCDPVQQLINEGLVDRVIPTDSTVTSLLIIRYPSVLQFASNGPMNVTPERIIILANQAPSERDGSDWRYVTATCSANAERLFGVKPLWVPEGPETRQALEDEGLLSGSDVAEFNMPCILNVDDWYLPRRRFRSDLPVVGRHSRDHHTKWPETRSALLEIYPDDPSIDVRILGGARTVLSVLGTDRLPMNWTGYDYDEVPVRTYLHQLDFWVYFHHPILVESFGRAILEAIAGGCVVILPPEFQKTFGDGAVYCQSNGVRGVIDHFYSDFRRYRDQSERGMEFVRDQFSYERYLGLLHRICDAPADTLGPRVGPTTI